MPGVPDPDVAVERADALVGQRRPEEATAVVSEALAAHPEHPELWGELALALLAAGRPASALDAAAQRVRLAPDDEWGHRLASLALSRLERPAEAVEAARASVRLAPDEPLAHSRRRPRARRGGAGRDAGRAARRADLVGRVRGRDGSGDPAAPRRPVTR